MEAGLFSAMVASKTGLSARAKPNHSEEGSKPAPGLTLVATPIGNLDDLSARARTVLATADLIACEDTRVTGKLLSLLGIGPRPLTAYHDHNAEKARPALLAKLREGMAVALVSDAGTPMVSDPGYRLVQDCLAEGIAVTAVPGASAVLTALQLSGLPSHRFLFEGFLASKTVARRRQLEELAAVPATLVFYESPKRLAASLADMAAVLGARPAAVARELTKLYEEVRRASLSQLAAHYEEAGPPKGEIVVVVGPPEAEPPRSEAEIEEDLRLALTRLSLKDAVSEIAAKSGLPRRTLYARAVALAGRR